MSMKKCWSRRQCPGQTMQKQRDRFFFLSRTFQRKRCEGTEASRHWLLRLVSVVFSLQEAHGHTPDCCLSSLRVPLVSRGQKERILQGFFHPVV